MSGFGAYAGSSQIGEILPIGSTGARLIVAKEASNGDYRLKTVNTKNFTDSADKFAMDNGRAKINLSSASDYIYADSKTVVCLLYTSRCV